MATLFDPFDFKAQSPLHPVEQEVVNTYFQVEKVLNPSPWDRWYPNGINLYRTNQAVCPNSAAIRQACDIVGLRDIPAIYHNSNNQGELGATYRLSHIPALISFDHLLTAKAASVVLWHELRHAAQHEQAGYLMPYGPMPQFYNDPAGYWYHPDEVDARKFEKYGLEIPLVYEVDNYIPPTMEVMFS